MGRRMITDATSLPMILLGGSGDMTASLFVNTILGAEDPLNGGYLENSLNLGGFGTRWQGEHRTPPSRFR